MKGIYLFLALTLLSLSGLNYLVEQVRKKGLKTKLKEIILKEASYLYPGYFALVMATGIISIAFYLLEMVSLSWFLFLINRIAYVVLWFLTLVRLFRYPHNLIADLTDHVRGPGFFTIVAGTCILGNEFILIASDFTTAIILWFIGLFLWLILIYAFFTAMIVHEPKPRIETGIHGGWFIAVVATQSVSILGTFIASKFLAWQGHILFFTLILYLFGCMLYILILSLIFYRLTFFSLTAKSFVPVYWVNMGAAAITTLAGARLILSSTQLAFLQDILPFLKGFTLFFWATATWWIPLLFILDIWRHFYKHHPLGYDPQYWSMVFPLGMYTTCTLVFSRVTGLTLLYPIPGYFVYIALLAWSAAFVGLIYRIISKFLQRFQSL